MMAFYLLNGEVVNAFVVSEEKFITEEAEPSGYVLKNGNSATECSEAIYLMLEVSRDRFSFNTHTHTCTLFLFLSHVHVLTHTHTLIHSLIVLPFPFSHCFY